MKSIFERQRHLIEDQVVFQGAAVYPLLIIPFVIIGYGQLYRVPFDRNSDRVKTQHFQYVQVISAPWVISSGLFSDSLFH